MLPNDSRETLQAQLAAIVEQSSDAILSKTLDGVITSWNRAAEQLFGYSAAEAVGRPVSLIFPPELPDEFPTIMERLRRGERIERYHTVRRHKDGHRLDVSVSISPIRDAEGTIVGASAITHDITERQRLRRQLDASRAEVEESAQRLRLAAEAAGFGVYDDAGPGQVYWSSEMKALFGLPPEAAADDGAATALALIHPDDRDRWLAALAAARDPAGTGEMSVEHRIVRPDGSIIWVAQHGRILFEGEGSERRRVRAVGVVQDITARKQAEEALRQSEERLRLALRTVQMAAFSQDRDLRYTWIDNPNGTLTPDNSAGKTDADFVVPEEAEALARLKRQVLETGVGVRADIARATETGTTYHDVTIEPLRDESGTVIGLYGVSLDVTERKQREAGRDAFITILTHDLKSPLTTVQGTVQLLQRRLARTGGVESERLSDGFSRIEMGTARAVKMLNELLDLSRLGAGEPLALERAEHDLVALARAVIAEQQLATGVPIELVASDGPVTGVWDAPRLERVLMNLIGNAVKYSPDGGTVTVTVGRDEAAGQAVLAVADEGLGIPAADIPNLFQAFQRGSNVVGRIGGAGIGLLSVKQVVEQHGGTIAVESVLGEGSRFTVRLPLTPPEAET